jgi:hypothetical protein
VAIAANFLTNPVNDPGNPWTQFCSAAGKASASIAAATIQIRNGVADYTLPAEVWEQMSSRNAQIFYRVHASTAATGAPSFTSHRDSEVRDGTVPFVNVLRTGTLTDANLTAIPSSVVSLLSEEEKSWLRTVDALADGNSDKEALRRILAHAVYRDRTAEEQSLVLRLYVRAGSNGRPLVARLLDQRVMTPAGQTQAALFTTDQVGEASLLRHLIAVYDVPLHRRVRAPQSDIVFDVLSEICDPGIQINQGNAGTCAATSVQLLVTLRNPAEVARWARHLLNMNELSVVLANGQRMGIDTLAFDPTAWNAFHSRTYTERAIQAALMDYGNFRARYDATRDTYITWLGAALGSGLWEFEITRTLEAIFNEPWEWEFGGAGRSMNAPDRGAIGTRVSSHLQANNDPVIMVFLWGTGAHAVCGLRVQDGRVVFRNPQYRGAFPLGTDNQAFTQPDRRIVRALYAEESVDQASMSASIRGFIKKSGAGGEFGYRATEIPSQLQASVPPTLT